MRKFWIFKAILIGIVAVSFFSWAVMLLWNWLVPVLFSGPMITFWQALGLLVLSKILFSGFGRKGHPGGHGPQKPFWRKRFKEKWEKMTPEERDKFRARFKHRCNNWGWNVEEEPSPTTAQQPSAGTQP
jgi:hypothetical protein